MRFVRKAEGEPAHLAILSGAFHPPTRAHMALAEAALVEGHVSEVLLILPDTFPHKQYDHIGIDQRVELVLAAIGDHPQYSIAISDGGLFLDIAREARASYGPSARLQFLCGRDTAERIVHWDYNNLPPIESQFEEYQLLVAPRQGVFTPPAHLSHAVAHLNLGPSFDWISSSQVRARIADNLEWQHLVPPSIAARVADLYQTTS